MLSNKKRRSILRFWSQRYLLTLLIGLVIIGTVSTLWIRQTTIENRLNITHLVAQEIADRIVSSNGRILEGPLFETILNDRSQILNFPEAPTAVVVDAEGRILTSNRRPGRDLRLGEQVPSSLYEEKESTISLDGRTAFIISEPILNNEETVGYVVLVQYKSVLAESNQEYRLLFILLLTLGLLGWLVIYYLTKQLTKPLKETVEAARKVSKGEYEVTITQHPKEKELAELTETFQDMAEKLQNLERVRSELLAGVTHDLKTPVTSISGLLQAIRDEVVSEEEAQEFLNLSLKETERLKIMIQDLLTFNTFVAGSLPVYPKRQAMNDVLKEIEQQWVRTEESTPLNIVLPQDSIIVSVDENRLKQILMNLLLNAKQAMKDDDGGITVVLEAKEGMALIHVQDEGSGIPDQDLPFIFERFYRGSNKKLRVRGLGLGLSISSLLAKAQEGELLVTETSESGTTFTLRFPLA
ncbi:HAMP domain-containing protein [Halobacillus litoralis]|uniref:ATP-binding protein n=1 Tax=Halobacillus litoralis TaxID=45668 RepID=UPI001CD24915|nr:ATP-binding protein [Halobacillus litoralis]MCA0971951.1 HAMP domain-containing protein [Halobacillus litoralis]